MVGDSIAHAAGSYAPHCLKATWPGLNSKRWLTRFADITIEAEIAIISMGTNEGLTNSALADLAALRGKVNARRVMWIAPGPQYPSRKSVIRIAADHGDLVYERPIENLARDGIHFTNTGSKRIALLTKELVAPTRD